MKKFFANNDFDYVIDFRTKPLLLQELIIHNFVYPKFIQTIHSFKLQSYLPKNKFLAKLLYRNCEQFITVSKGIYEKVSTKYNFLPTKLIYNPIDFELISKQSKQKIADDFQYVLSAGSMNKNIKQFLWILLLNETSLHPILRNAHQTPHIASSTIPIFQYQTVIVLPSWQSPFSSKVFFFFI